MTVSTSQQGDGAGKGTGNGRTFATQQSLNGAIKAICDVMRRSNCAGALQYVPELTWILFLRILDEHETFVAEEAAAVGEDYTPALDAPYRWQDWAAPGGHKRLESPWPIWCCTASTSLICGTAIR